MNLSSALRLAVKAAKRSVHDKTRVGAVVFRGHSVVAASCNRTSERTPDYSAHAERIALSDAGYEADSITVARVGKAGLIYDSFPCATCLNMLRSCGVTRLEFVQNGERKVIRL